MIPNWRILMSRTIRRTGDKKRNKSGGSHFETDYTHTYDESDRYSDVGAWRAKPRIKMEGHEYFAQYHKFHGCTCRGYGWGNHTYSRWYAERQCRSVNKREIVRWLADDMYEIFTHNPPCLSYDR